MKESRQVHPERPREGVSSSDATQAEEIVAGVRSCTLGLCEADEARSSCLMCVSVCQSSHPAATERGQGQAHQLPLRTVRCQWGL